jgi:hypothetical protein
VIDDLVAQEKRHLDKILMHARNYGSGPTTLNRLLTDRPPFRDDMAPRQYNYPFNKAANIEIPQVGGFLGRADFAAAPPPNGQPTGPNYYNLSDNDISELMGRVEADRAGMDNMTKQARHSDPHDPGHLEVMRELSRATRSYINSCRTLIEACDLNIQRPMMAQGAGNAGGTGDGSASGTAVWNGPVTAGARRRG